MDVFICKYTKIIQIACIGIEKNVFGVIAIIRDNNGTKTPTG